jgi:hypothetical protein
MKWNEPRKIEIQVKIIQIFWSEFWLTRSRDLIKL